MIELDSINQSLSTEGRVTLINSDNRSTFKVRYARIIIAGPVTLSSNKYEFSNFSIVCGTLILGKEVNEIQFKGRNRIECDRISVIASGRLLRLKGPNRHRCPGKISVLYANKKEINRRIINIPEKANIIVNFSEWI